MEQHSRGIRVEVYFGETDQVRHKPRYQVLLEYLRAEGAAGATVTRGIAGFGHNSRIHTSAILRLSEDLPLILTWIDAPERVARLLPGLRQLAGSGAISVEEIGIAGYGQRRLEQLRFDLPVSDVMTAAPVTTSPDTTLREAAESLIGREFRALPVVDTSGGLLGMLSNGDLVERGGLGARLELLEAMVEEERNRMLERIPTSLSVGQAMTSDPVSVAADAKLADATRLMSQRRLKRLPVTDRDGSVVGILSRGDVLRAVAEAFPRETELTTEHPGATTVGELMRRDVPAVPADADLPSLLNAVISTRLNRAIVIDHDRRVLGVVSDADVLRSLGSSMTQGVVGALMGAAGLAGHSTRRAEELITSEPRTLRFDTPLAEAARLVMSHRRKVLPVVDDEGRLLGIVDRAELLQGSREALDEIAREAVLDDEE